MSLLIYTQHNWDQEPGLDRDSSQGRFYVSVIHLWWQICDFSWGTLREIKLKTMSSFSGTAVSLDQCSSCCPVPLHMGKKFWHENTSSHNRHYHNKLSLSAPDPAVFGNTPGGHRQLQANWGWATAEQQDHKHVKLLPEMFFSISFNRDNALFSGDYPQ